MTDEKNGQDEQNKTPGEPVEKPAGQVIVTEKKNSSLGLASLITGITSLLSISCCGPLAFLLAITAIILGIIARNEGQDYATVGIILGALGIVIPILLIIFFAGFAFVVPIIDTIF